MNEEREARPVPLSARICDHKDAINDYRQPIENRVRLSAQPGPGFPSLDRDENILKFLWGTCVLMEELAKKIEESP